MTAAPSPSLDGGPSRGPLTITEREFRRFQALVHAASGIALSDSKRPMVCARLGRRLRHYGYTSFSQYWQHLQERDARGEELVRLINAITTNKTEFFREAHHFDCLRTTVLPALAARDGAHRLRIWSAGCSTGEEPYSIAYTLLANLPRPASWDVRILASDIDTDVLAVAEAAVYAFDRIDAVPVATRPRLFLRGGPGGQGLVRVRDEVRRLVVFRRINLCEEPWPIRTVFDCIFCRNVIIYFDKAFQERLVSRFVALLRPGGYLFLGHSESLLGLRVGLSHIANTVYRKAAAADGGTAKA